MAGRNWTFVVALCVLLTACGQKKVEGPLPETGNISLRVLYLADPKLPGLSDEELQGVLDRAVKQIETHLDPPRRLNFSMAGRADLEQQFQKWTAPFGRVSFQPRLDPEKSMSDENKSVFYARIMELLRTGKLRTLFPRFSLNHQDLDMANILETVERRFEQSDERIRPFFKAARRDRQSVFTWFTLFGTMTPDSKPADLILTNDLLIFDSLSTLPPETLLSGGVAAGYTRIYPGIALASTLPFLSEDTWFAELRGTLEKERRLDLLSAAIAHEVGGKLMLMNQDELGHADCLNQVLLPPFAQDPPGKDGTNPCREKHKPQLRRQLLIDYLAGYVQLSNMSGHPESADAALERLHQLSPEHPVVEQFRSRLKTPSAS